MSAAILRLILVIASIEACTHSIAPRLNSTCSRTCQSSERETSRFRPCTIELSAPPGRGFTEPIAATFASAASRACTQRHEIRGIHAFRAQRTLRSASAGLVTNVEDRRRQFLIRHFRRVPRLRARRNPRRSTTAGREISTSVARTGLQARTMSAIMRLTTFSWKMPRFRYSMVYILSDFSSRHVFAGT